MDNHFKKRKTGKDKEKRNRELNGKHSSKHIRIQEQCQENHLKNIQILQIKGKTQNDKNHTS
jgi:hypothetical protein